MYRLRVLALATLSLIVLTLIIAEARRTSPMFPVSDEAMTEIYTRHALNGAQFTGPYSRFGWQHPGPMYFYFLVPFYVAAGQRTAGLNAGALVRNLLMVVTSGWILIRRREYAILVSFSLFVLLYARALGDMIASSWNAHVAVLPLLALAISAAAAAAGAYVWLPVMVAIGSFALQTHLAVAPVVAVSLTCAVGAPFLQRHLAREARAVLRRWLAASVLVGAALWALPLADAFRNGGGNLGEILRFFAVGTGTSQPLPAAVAGWAEMLTSVVRQTVQVPRGVPFRPSPSLAALVIAGLEVFVLAVVVIRNRRTRTFRFWLSAIALATSLAAIAASAKVPEELNDHQVFWISAVGLLNASIVVGLSCSRLMRRFWLPDRVSRFAAVALLAYLGLWFTDSGLSALARVAARSRHPAPEERFVRATTTAVGDLLGRQPSNRVLVHLQPGTWHLTAGLVLQLYKSGIHASVDSSVAMYGERFRPRGTEDFAVAILNAEDYSRRAGVPGDIPIFERDDLFVVGWRLPASGRR